MVALREPRPGVCTKYQVRPVQQADGGNDLRPPYQPPYAPHLHCLGLLPPSLLIVMTYLHYCGPCATLGAGPYSISLPSKFKTSWSSVIKRWLGLTHSLRFVLSLLMPNIPHHRGHMCDSCGSEESELTITSNGVIRPG